MISNVIKHQYRSCQQKLDSTAGKPEVAYYRLEMILMVCVASLPYIGELNEYPP